MSKKKSHDTKPSESGSKWFEFKIAEVFKQVNSTKDGLTGTQVKTRQAKFGPNSLPDKKSLAAITVFLGQFKSAFIYILLIAAGLSYLLGESIDATVILVAVLINVVVGFFQEYKAQKSLEALQKVVSSQARVRRDGRIKLVSATELVPGDVVLLQAGDKVPADVRLLDIKNLEIAEATLTGESAPIKKDISALAGDLVLGDQLNMAFMSTQVTQGTGTAVVVGTGTATAIGHIATLVRETKEENTPLQEKLDKFGKKLAFIVLGISAVIFVVGLLYDYEVGEMFTTAVAVAVAAIPEGLVVAVTVILAVGMRRILKEQGLVKKLLAAETLGSTSVICTDKTGTLTQGEMRVSEIIGESQAWDMKNLESAEAEAEYGLSLRIGVLCNNAFFMSSLPLAKGDLSTGAADKKRGSEADQTSPDPPEVRRGVKINGSPTEKALLLAGWQVGLDKEALDKKYLRLDEVPFDSKIKYMMTLHKFSNTQNIIYLKGASEKVLDLCSFVYRSGDGKSHDHLPLDKALRLKQKKQYEKMSTSGLRVLAMAYKKVPVSVKSFNDLEGLGEDTSPRFSSSQEENALLRRGKNEFVFVGFMGLQDPLRPDTKETIAISRRAGVKTVMITGDHKLTAQAIAKELGLPHDTSNILTGKDLANLTASQLK